MTGSDHEGENTRVSISNAPEGGWGVGGRAFTGEQPVRALAG